MNKKTALCLLIAVIFLSLIGFAKAQSGGININNVPNEVSTQLGVNIFVAQLISSAFVIVMISALVGYAIRGSKSQLPIIAVCDFLGMGICVGLSWLPVWTFTVCIFMVALLAGLRFKDLI